MSIHIIKLVVGVQDMAHFLEVQERYAIDYEGERAIPVRTRNRPKREKELVAEGSLYRVIKNRIQCRQKILGFETVQDKEKGTMCQIMVSPEIIQTVSTPKKPFQGWRYLEPAAAPRDLGVYDPANDAEIPAEMEQALRESGLI